MTHARSEAEQLSHHLFPGHVSVVTFPIQCRMHRGCAEAKDATRPHFEQRLAVLRLGTAVVRKEALGRAAGVLGLISITAKPVIATRSRMRAGITVEVSATDRQCLA